MKGSMASPEFHLSKKPRLSYDSSVQRRASQAASKIRAKARKTAALLGFNGFTEKECENSAQISRYLDYYVLQETEKERVLEKEFFSAVGLSCTWCPLIFTSTRHLEKHHTFCNNRLLMKDSALFLRNNGVLDPVTDDLLREPSSGMFLCPWCPILCSSLPALHKHLPKCKEGKRKREKQVVKLFPCPECSFKSRTFKSLLLHLQSHYVSDLLCSPCNKSFPNKRHLSKHLKLCNHNETYHCSDCGMTFVKSSELREHLNHCESLLQCLKCAEVAIDRAFCLGHISTHLTREWEKLGLLMSDGVLLRVTNEVKLPEKERRKPTLPDNYLLSSMSKVCNSKSSPNQSVNEFSICGPTTKAASVSSSEKIEPNEKLNIEKRKTVIPPTPQEIMGDALNSPPDAATPTNSRFKFARRSRTPANSSSSSSRRNSTQLGLPVCSETKGYVSHRTSEANGIPSNELSFHDESDETSSSDDDNFSVIENEVYEIENNVDEADFMNESESNCEQGVLDSNLPCHVGAEVSDPPMPDLDVQETSERMTDLDIASSTDSAQEITDLPMPDLEIERNPEDTSHLFIPAVNDTENGDVGNELTLTVVNVEGGANLFNWDDEGDVNNEDQYSTEDQSGNPMYGTNCDFPTVPKSNHYESNLAVDNNKESNEDGDSGIDATEDRDSNKDKTEDADVFNDVCANDVGYKIPIMVRKRGEEFPSVSPYIGDGSMQCDFVVPNEIVASEVVVSSDGAVSSDGYKSASRLKKEAVVQDRMKRYSVLGEHNYCIPAGHSLPWFKRRAKSSVQDESSPSQSSVTDFKSSKESRGKDLKKGAQAMPLKHSKKSVGKRRKHKLTLTVGLTHSKKSYKKTVKFGEKTKAFTSKHSRKFIRSQQSHPVATETSSKALEQDIPAQASLVGNHEQSKPSSKKTMKSGIQTNDRTGKHTKKPTKDEQLVPVTTINTSETAEQLVSGLASLVRNAVTSKLVSEPVSLVSQNNERNEGISHTTLSSNTLEKSTPPVSILREKDDEETTPIPKGSVKSSEANSDPTSHSNVFSLKTAVVNPTKAEYSSVKIVTVPPAARYPDQAKVFRFFIPLSALKDQAGLPTVTQSKLQPVQSFVPATLDQRGTDLKDTSSKDNKGRDESDTAQIGLAVGSQQETDNTAITKPLILENDTGIDSNSRPLSTVSRQPKTSSSNVPETLVSSLNVLNEMEGKLPQKFSCLTSQEKIAANVLNTMFQRKPKENVVLSEYSQDQGRALPSSVNTSANSKTLLDTTSQKVNRKQIDPWEKMLRREKSMLARGFKQMAVTLPRREDICKLSTSSSSSKKAQDLPCSLRKSSDAIKDSTEGAERRSVRHTLLQQPAVVDLQNTDIAETPKSGNLFTFVVASDGTLLPHPNFNVPLIDTAVSSKENLPPLIPLDCDSDKDMSLETTGEKLIGSAPLLPPLSCHSDKDKGTEKQQTVTERGLSSKVEDKTFLPQDCREVQPDLEKKIEMSDGDKSTLNEVESGLVSPSEKLLDKSNCNPQALNKVHENPAGNFLSKTVNNTSICQSQGEGDNLPLLQFRRMLQSKLVSTIKIFDGLQIDKSKLCEKSTKVIRSTDKLLDESCDISQTSINLLQNSADNSQSMAVNNSPIQSNIGGDEFCEESASGSVEKLLDKFSDIPQASDNLFCSSADTSQSNTFQIQSIKEHHSSSLEKNMVEQNKSKVKGTSKASLLKALQSTVPNLEQYNVVLMSSSDEDSEEEEEEEEISVNINCSDIDSNTTLVPASLENEGNVPEGIVEKKTCPENSIAPSPKHSDVELSIPDSTSVPEVPETTCPKSYLPESDDIKSANCIVEMKPSEENINRYERFEICDMELCSDSSNQADSIEQEPSTKQLKEKCEEFSCLPIMNRFLSKSQEDMDVCDDSTDECEKALSPSSDHLLSGGCTDMDISDSDTPEEEVSNLNSSLIGNLQDRSLGVSLKHADHEKKYRTGTAKEKKKLPPQFRTYLYYSRKLMSEMKQIKRGRFGREGLRKSCNVTMFNCNNCSQWFYSTLDLEMHVCSNFLIQQKFTSEHFDRFYDRIKENIEDIQLLNEGHEEKAKDKQENLSVNGDCAEKIENKHVPKQLKEGMSPLETYFSMKHHKKLRCIACDKCHIKFRSFSALLEHKTTVHTENSSLSCHICGKEFSRLQKLAVHFAKSHKAISQNTEKEEKTNAIRDRKSAEDQTKLKKKFQNEVQDTNTDLTSVSVEKTQNQTYQSDTDVTSVSVGKTQNQTDLTNADVTSVSVENTQNQTEQSNSDVTSVSVEKTQNQTEQSEYNAANDTTQCKICNRIFNAKGLKSHMNQAHGNLFKCPVCQRRFTYLTTMKIHYLKHFVPSKNTNGLRQKSVIPLHAIEAPPSPEESKALQSEGIIEKEGDVREVPHDVENGLKLLTNETTCESVNASCGETPVKKHKKSKWKIVKDSSFEEKGSPEKLNTSSETSDDKCLGDDPSPRPIVISLSKVKKPCFTCQHCDKSFKKHHHLAQHRVEVHRSVLFTCPVCLVEQADLLQLQLHIYQCNDGAHNVDLCSKNKPKVALTKPTTPIVSVHPTNDSMKSSDNDIIKSQVGNKGEEKSLLMAQSQCVESVVTLQPMQDTGLSSEEQLSIPSSGPLATSPDDTKPKEQHMTSFQMKEMVQDSQNHSDTSFVGIQPLQESVLSSETQLPPCSGLPISDSLKENCSERRRTRYQAFSDALRRDHPPSPVPNKLKCRKLTWKCDECTMEFKTKGFLERHNIKNHGAPSRLNCSLCNRIFTDIRSLQFHHKRKHSKKKWTFSNKKTDESAPLDSTETDSLAKSLEPDATCPSSKLNETPVEPVSAETLVCTSPSSLKTLEAAEAEAASTSLAPGATPQKVHSEKSAKRSNGRSGSRSDPRPSRKCKYCDKTCRRGIDLKRHYREKHHKRPIVIKCRPQSTKNRPSSAHSHPSNTLSGKEEVPDTIGELISSKPINCNSGDLVQEDSLSIGETESNALPCVNVHSATATKSEENEKSSAHSNEFCNIENQEIKSKREVQSGTTMPSGEKEVFKCSDCPLTYRTFSCLKRHRILIHAEPASHYCKICGKGFSYPHSLKNHTMTHSRGRYKTSRSEKPIKCQSCENDCHHHQKPISNHLTPVTETKTETIPEGLVNTTEVKGSAVPNETVQKLDKPIENCAETKANDFVSPAEKKEEDNSHSESTAYSSLVGGFVQNESVVQSCSENHLMENQAPRSFDSAPMPQPAFYSEHSSLDCVPVNNGISCNSVGNFASSFHNNTLLQQPAAASYVPMINGSTFSAFSPVETGRQFSMQNENSWVPSFEEFKAFNACSLCGLCLPSWYALQEHYYVAHPPPTLSPYTAPQVHPTFYSHESVSTSWQASMQAPLHHQPVAENFSPTKMSEDGASSIQELSSHSVVHCSVCGLCFPSVFALQEHYATHMASSKTPSFQYNNFY